MIKKLNKLIALSGIRGKLQRNKFESNGYYYYSGQRATFTEALKHIQHHTRALDIGAGFGNEVKILLKRGFTVVATDPNPVAVKHLKRIARRHRSLTVYQQSLPAIPRGVFDLVVCEMVLHFLTKDSAHTSIKRMQAATASDGLNVISCYLEQALIHSDPRIKQGYFKFLLESGELEELYRGWEIIYYKEMGNALGFKSARLIARKK